ncbi:hypothetical protein D3C71_1856630 [compost metagenome]
MFCKPAAGLAENAERMRFVDHQPEAVFGPELQKRRQVGDIAVHRVDALDDDHDAAIVAGDRA